jgi:hypothetical protein
MPSKSHENLNDLQAWSNDNILSREQRNTSKAPQY